MSQTPRKPATPPEDDVSADFSKLMASWLPTLKKREAQMYPPHDPEHMTPPVNRLPPAQPCMDSSELPSIVILGART